MRMGATKQATPARCGVFHPSHRPSVPLDLHDWTRRGYQISNVLPRPNICAHHLQIRSDLFRPASCFTVPNLEVSSVPRIGLRDRSSFGNMVDPRSDTETPNLMATCGRVIGRMRRWHMPCQFNRLLPQAWSWRREALAIGPEHTLRRTAITGKGWPNMPPPQAIMSHCTASSGTRPRLQRQHLSGFTPWAKLPTAMLTIIGVTSSHSGILRAITFQAATPPAPLSPQQHGSLSAHPANPDLAARKMS
jgi:hypothetical protein